MATTGELTTVIAQAAGVNPQSIIQVARNLRAGKLLSSGGRGRHAARMTIRDATLIVIAMLISDQPAAAARAIEDCRRLTFAGQIEPGGPPQSLFCLPYGCASEGGKALNFIDAVVYVITTLASHPGKWDDKSSYVRISFDTEDVSCQIETESGIYIYRVIEYLASVVPKLSAKGEEALEFWTAIRGSYQHSKIWVRRTIGSEILLAIAQTFTEPQA